MMIDFNYLWDKHNIHAKGVLHLGASTGQERDVYDKLGVQKVYWVEAIPEVFQKLKENLKHYPNQLAIKACISNEDGNEVVFHISNNEAQSSSMLELGTHKDIHPEVKYIDSIVLETVTVQTLFRRLELDTSELTFLNIDLQGAELMALEGMGDMLKQFKYVYSEVNKKATYINCPHIDDLDYFLLQHGFERVETGEWVADTWTDALYIKK